MLYLRGTFRLPDGTILPERTFHKNDVFSDEIRVELLRTGFAVSVSDSAESIPPRDSADSGSAPVRPQPSSTPTLTLKRKKKSRYETREMVAK